MSHQRDEDTGTPGGRALPPRIDPRAGRAPKRRPAARSRGPRSSGSDRPARRRIVAGVRLLAAALALSILAVSGWGWHLGRLADASVNRTDAIPSAGNEGGGEAMNLLLAGNDSRSRLTPEQLGQLNAGADSGLNTDTVILVHVPSDGSQASFVSFPRDSYVEIPGHGQDKLNAAYALGYQGAPEGSDEATRQAAGAQLLIQTISHLTGLQVDHYAEVDLLGFFELSNVVGGVEVNLCAPARDRYSGVDLPAGVQTISGEQALAFVRQRHGLPRGDFDRIVRQQTFIAGMIRKMLSENVLLDLGKQRQLVQAAAGSLTVDRSLDLMGLASQMQAVTAGSIEFQTIPYVGDDEDENGRYILRLEDEQTLHAFFADLSAEPGTQEPGAAEPGAAEPGTEEPSEALDPGEVSVAVYNGSGVAGLAGETAAVLEAAEFVVTDTGNADNSGYTATEIRFAPGDEALAATLATVVPGATTVQSDVVAGGIVELVLGSDFAGVGAAPSAGATEGPADDTAVRTAADTTCIN